MLLKHPSSTAATLRCRGPPSPKGRLNAGAATDQKASPRRWRSCQPSEARMTDEGAKAITASVSGNGLSSFSCLKKNPCAEASLIHRSFLAVPGGRAAVPAEQIAARSTPFWVSEGWIHRMVKIAFGDRPRGGLIASLSRPPVLRLPNHPPDGRDRRWRPAPGRAAVPAEQIAARSPPSQPSTGWSGSPMATGFELLNKGSRALRDLLPGADQKASLVKGGCQPSETRMTGG